MRIAIVGASPIPFCRGGIENFMAGLYRAINDYTNHSAELIKIPVSENTVPNLLKAYWKFYKLALDHYDLVITTKYPAWNLRHRNHIIYLGHRLRGLYDTYPIDPADDSLFKSSPLAFPGPWIKRAIHWLDNQAIQPKTVSYAFCTSHTIAARKEYFHPDLPPEVVYHSTAREDYYSKPGEHIFTVNRLDAPKRVDLMIRAYKLVDTQVPFLIAGTGPQLQLLKNLAVDDSRICFLEDVSEEKLLDLYARSIGVIYTPYAEDYGLITVEAMKSGKPVITTSDSGGPLEFVKHGINGWIAEPNPESLASCIQELVQNTDIINTMAETALETVSGITWKNTVEKILKPYQYWPLREARKSSDRRRVTMLTPYPIYPPRSGGQRRVAGICSELSKLYDVFILSLGRFNTSVENMEINPWLHEIRIPIAPAHAKIQWIYEKEIGETVSDAALDRLLPKTPNYIRALHHFAEASDIIISEQPYMHRHIPESKRTQLIVHSSQNFEFKLKENILKNTRKGRVLLSDTRAAEEFAVKNSDILFATSSDEGNDLIKFYGREKGRWALAPNGVDTKTIKPFTEKRRISARKRLEIPANKSVFLFVGAWHPPNLEALLFIIKDLAPGFPDDLFLIVGSVRDHYKHQIGDPDSLAANIHLTGEVTEKVKADALAAANIALNPMISGAGTNLKILEYAAAGIPSLSTSVGIRGLSLIPDKDVLIAEPDTFSKSLKLLAENLKLQKELALSARKTVVAIYDWKSIGQHMIETIEQAIPPVGFSMLDMASEHGFSWGWYQPEKWDNAGLGTNNSEAGDVRWTTDKAGFSIASPRKPVELSITVQAGQPNQIFQILFNGNCIARETLSDTWQTISMPFTPQPGTDFADFIIETSGWRPSDQGSADTRYLGVAISQIRYV